MTQLRSKSYSMNTLCEYMGLSRQAYHQRFKHRQRKANAFEEAEEKVIDNRRQKSRTGLRTIYHKEQLSTLLGINSFEKEMSTRGYALKPYKSYLKTTDSRGHYNKFGNLISGLDVQSENQVIVGDITYYKNTSGLYYIFQFRDYYTLEIKGMLGSKTLEGINAEKCLRQVFEYNNKSKYNHTLILHTDGGGQYRSNTFQNILRKAQVRPSHARNCLENGLSERTNGIVKNEYLIDYNIKSVNHLNKVLKKIKHQVNQVWPSKTLGYLTPMKFAEKMRQINSEQRPVKTIREVETK